LAKGAKRDHLIVPLFIPNEGCPYQCIYCHQEKITSQSSNRINASAIIERIEKAIHSDQFEINPKNEVAFYGGTFTGLPEVRELELLEIVQPYIQRGLFGSIRVSTRPDAIDRKQIKLLRDNHVTTVELGAQSLDNRVLSLAHRGYRNLDIRGSVTHLKHHGFKVGLQLMPGLPGDSRDIFLRGIDEVIQLKPDMVRLYPTLVIKDTKLEKLYRQNLYHPLELSEAVEICEQACINLEEAGIPVIRIGLMTSETLNNQIVAGPWHESFGFLVRSKIYHGKIASQLPGNEEFTRIILKVNPADFSLLKGHRNDGLRLIEKKTNACVLKINQDDSLPPGKIMVEGRN
jgi:histone acetyltransferase (RNA polymerase elongator complex component)